jgi:hypothetical protein
VSIRLPDSWIIYPPGEEDPQTVVFRVVLTVL